MFHAILRPGQGFRSFLVLEQQNDIAANGRPLRHAFTPIGQITGLLMRASQNEVQQWKPRNQGNQEGHPVTHKIIQYCGAANALPDERLAVSLDAAAKSPRSLLAVPRVKPTDVLQLISPEFTRPPTHPPSLTELSPAGDSNPDEPSAFAGSRFFWVQGIHNPAELGHFVIYYAQEREDLQG